MRWVDRMENAVLHRVKEKNILRTIKKKGGERDWSHLTQELPSEAHY